jgi:hypothetical protein
LSLAAPPRLGRCLVEPVDRVDPDLGDGVGVLLGHGLDLDAALAESMPRCFLAARSRVKLA